jgi:hypothetical protein
VVEDRLGGGVVAEIGRRGHRVTRAGPWSLGRLSGAGDPESGFLFAGANPRGQAATAQFLAERKLTAARPDFDAQDLFEFYPKRCLWTQTSGHGDWNPRHTIWRSG